MCSGLAGRRPPRCWWNYHWALFVNRVEEPPRGYDHCRIALCRDDVLKS